MRPSGGGVRVVRDVHRHNSRVDEIERPYGEPVGAYVVTKHLNIRSVDRVEETDLEVGSAYSSFRADAFRKPTGDRATAAAYLETLCAATNRERLDAWFRQRAETLLNEQRHTLDLGPTATSSRGHVESSASTYPARMPRLGSATSWPTVLPPEKPI